VDDKNALLNQLRIERGASAEEGGRPRRWVLIGVGVVLVVVLAAGARWFFAKQSGIPVTEAIAVEAPGGGGTRIGKVLGASMLDASGYVVARRSATVASKSILRVMDVMFEEGQYVKEGQILARLDDSNTRAALEQAEAQLMQALANLKAAKTALADQESIYQRNQKQFEAKVISAQAFDIAQATYNAAEGDYNVRVQGVEVARKALEVARRFQNDTIVRAPFSGVVVTKAAQVGEIVSPSSGGGGFTRTGICTIVDMDSLEVEVDVNENFIDRVKARQPATVKLNAYPDWEIAAEVVAVVPTADRSKATVKVRIAIKQKDERVLPEMGARVSFLSTPDARGAGSSSAPEIRGVIIPDGAVQRMGDVGIVFVINGSTVERREVKLGNRTAEGQIVLSGISPGTRVTVGNLDALTDGAKVYVGTKPPIQRGESP
jgi:RND family efflux transporter MFP subunit